MDDRQSLIALKILGLPVNLVWIEPFCSQFAVIRLINIEAEIIVQISVVIISIGPRCGLVVVILVCGWRAGSNRYTVWPSTIQVVGSAAIVLGEDHLMICEYSIVLNALAPYNQFPPSLKILKYMVPLDRKMPAHLAGGILAREDRGTPQFLTGAPKRRESISDAFLGRVDEL
jgi:hypothetical protein